MTMAAAGIPPILDGDLPGINDVPQRRGGISMMRPGIRVCRVGAVINKHVRPGDRRSLDIIVPTFARAAVAEQHILRAVDVEGIAPAAGDLRDGIEALAVLH